MTSLLLRGLCDRRRAVDILPMSYRGRQLCPGSRMRRIAMPGALRPAVLLCRYPTCQKRRSMVPAFGSVHSRLCLRAKASANCLRRRRRRERPVCAARLRRICADRAEWMLTPRLS